MKICILTTSFPRFQQDPPGIFIHQMAREMVKKGHRVQVVAPGEKGVKKKEVMDGVEVSRFSYFWPRSLQNLAYGSGIPSNIRHRLIARLQIPFFLFSFFLKGLAAAKDCDIIFAQWTISGLVGVFLKKIYKNPLVLNVLGSDVNLTSALLVKLNLFTFRHADKILTISKNIKEKIASPQVPAEKVVLCPNGVNADIFKPMNATEAREKLRLSREKKILLFSGRLVPEKGLEYLLEAMTILHSNKENPLLVLLGDGLLKESLMAQVREKKMENDVLFFGSKPHQEMPLWINSADIIVLPSLSEGRPNIILEAMACEKAVVATDVGGIPELIQDGDNGFLVPAQNSNRLAEAIQKLLNNRDLVSQMGKRGRNLIIRQGLTWPEQTDKTLSVLEEVLLYSKRERRM